MPWIVTAWLYELFGQERLVRRRELRADQEREDAAEREEDERRADVEDPDPLVVDGRQPRGDPAAGASRRGRRRPGVSALAATGRVPVRSASSCTRRARRSGRRSSRCRRPASCPTPLRRIVVRPFASVSSGLLAERRADVAAVRAGGRPRRRARTPPCRARSRPGSRRRAAMNCSYWRAARRRPGRSSSRAGCRRARRSGRRTCPAGALNQVWFVRPGDRVDLAAELRHPPAVDHVVGGATTFSWTTSSAGRDHRPDRDARRSGSGTSQ